MKRREIIILSLLLIGAFFTIFFPNIKSQENIIGYKELLSEINKVGRYATTDEIANAIINNDPSYILIDVRDVKQFKSYTIDGAVNITLDKIMDEEYKDYLNTESYTVVLFSNGSSKADQVWLKLRCTDYKGIRVMKGGLNEWFKTIINPQKPIDNEMTAAKEKQYLFRKQASFYFTGTQVSSGVIKTKSNNKPIVKRKKKEVSGGCG